MTVDDPQLLARLEWEAVPNEYRGLPRLAHWPPPAPPRRTVDELAATWRAFGFYDMEADA